VKNEALIGLARDTDVLVHEALNDEMVGEIANQLETLGARRLEKIMHDIPDYHTSPLVRPRRRRRQAPACSSSPISSRPNRAASSTPPS
jgi:hypothetical protein